MRSSCKQPARLKRRESAGFLNRKAVLMLAAALSAGVALPISAGVPTNTVLVDTLAAGDGPGFVITSAYNFEAAGFSVSAAGDVNGDGLGDLIVGEPNYANCFSLGRTFVVYGKTDKNPVSLDDIEHDGTGGFLIRNGFQGGSSGYCVAAAGDMNGDGFADLLIGAPKRTTGPYTNFLFEAGSVWVLFGRENNPEITLNQIGSSVPGILIEGQHSQGRLGFSVNSAGDVNGDGFADIIIGAPNPSHTGNGFGNAYVVFGGASLPSLISEDQIGVTNPGFAIPGLDLGLPNTSPRVGFSVSGAGDFNGDGLSDVIVGAPFTAVNEQGEVGAAFIVAGKTDYAPASLVGEGSSVVVGSRNGERLGTSVSHAGDTDGDGFSDVVIGSWFQTVGATPGIPNRYGHAIVIGGGPDAFTIPDDEFDGGYDFPGMFFGAKTLAGTQLGLGVSLAGDMNGDGLTDVIVGQPKYGYCGAGCSTGRAYVVFGQPHQNPPVVTYDEDILGNPSTGLVLITSVAGSRFGKSVSEAGDVNGDGMPDVIVGAPGSFGTGGRSSGATTRTEKGFSSTVNVAYVVFNPLPPLTEPATYRLRNNPTLTSVRGISDDSNIGFPDSHAFVGLTGLADAAELTVTHTRSNDLIEGLSKTADDLWFFDCTESYTEARVKLRYTTAALGAIDENNLMLYGAHSPSGPWTRLTEVTTDTDRNFINGKSDNLAYLAIGIDDDGDEIASDVEDLVPNPDGLGFGDGNGDGIPDSNQANVVSITNAVNGDYITLSGDDDLQFGNVAAVAATNAPSNATFPFGLVQFSVTGFSGLGTDVTIHYENAPAIPLTDYFKTPMPPTTESYFNFTGPLSPFDSGAVFSDSQTVVLSLLDTNAGFLLPPNLSGDFDFDPSVIFDPGGPAFVSPLLATISSFTATNIGNGVQLDWTTTAETNNAGFNAYTYSNNSLTKLNATLIPAQGIDGAGSAYAFIDAHALRSGEARQYFLEDVDLNGTKTLHGPVTAGNLTAVQNWEMF
ncbi:MAG: integrin alpha [Candidatus Sumerlaeota bacterium]